MSVCSKVCYIVRREGVEEYDWWWRGGGRRGSRRRERGMWACWCHLVVIDLLLYASLCQNGEEEGERGVEEQ